MRIIISPAKKMNDNTDVFPCQELPAFLDKTQELLDYMQSLDYSQCKTIWKCNDKIAELNYRRFSKMDLEKSLTPAILSYEGIQYQYMAPQVFSERQWAYVKEHLRILSGLYGVLKPMDGVIPYRLEMQAKLRTGDAKDLYAFWSDRIYRELSKGEDFILNLASKEYSRAAEKYAGGETRFVTCIFGELLDGKVKVKGTMAKMARGEMVRWLSEKNITEPEKIKAFTGLSYGYDEGRSTENELVFLK